MIEDGDKAVLRAMCRLPGDVLRVRPEERGEAVDELLVHAMSGANRATARAVLVAALGRLWTLRSEPWED
jgi:hypothetical protein